MAHAPDVLVGGGGFRSNASRVIEATQKRFRPGIVFALWLGVSTAAGAATVAGFTPGEHDIDETGALHYRIPIAVPPGTAGMAPELALSYNSRSGNGLLGVGWSLSGLSMVHRCAKTIAQDGAVGGIDLTTGERYCLDGQRLVAVQGTYGANNTQYRTEIESFAKVVSYGSAGNGPAWFKVWTKSGQIIEYGNTAADARIEAQGRNEVLVWAANRVADTAGNYFNVKYAENNAAGSYWPTRIDYTGNGNVAPYASVRLAYEARADESHAFVAGSKLSTPVRLANIKTYVGDTLVHDYGLRYREESAGARRSYLERVTFCDGGGDCLPSTELGWSEVGNGRFEEAVPNAPRPDGSGDFTNYTPVTGDFNGDGVSDLVWTWQGASGLRAFVALGQWRPQVLSSR